VTKILAYEKFWPTKFFNQKSRSHKSQKS